jgi:hypothetical protein
MKTLTRLTQTSINTETTRSERFCNPLHFTMSLTPKSSNLLQHLTSPFHLNSTAAALFLLHQTPTKSLPKQEKEKSSQKSQTMNKKKIKK